MKETVLTEVNRKIARDIYDDDIDFVLTVPAIWGDTGKLFMQDAAVQVRIQFVTAIWYIPMYCHATGLAPPHRYNYITTRAKNIQVDVYSL